MNVAGEGERKVHVLVGDAARASVLNALEAIEEMAHQKLEVHPDDHAVLAKAHDRLAEIDVLRRQLLVLEDPFRMAGPEPLVASVMRGAASHAVYELETFVERVIGSAAPLDDNDLAEVKQNALAAVAAVEAFTACESRRAR